MRALTTILFATTTLLSGAAATAMAAEPAQQQPAYKQMVDIEGTYTLSDGHHARLFVSSGTLYIEFGRNQQALEPAGQDRWMARDHSMTLQFKPGRASDEIVLNYGNPAEASPIRLAAREAHGRGAVD
jgi:hypothetical protein